MVKVFLDIFDERPDFKDWPHVTVSHCFDQGWTRMVIEEGQNDGPVSRVNAVINVQMGRACPGAHLFLRDFRGAGSFSTEIP